MTPFLPSPGVLVGPNDKAQSCHPMELEAERGFRRRQDEQVWITCSVLRLVCSSTYRITSITVLSLRVPGKLRLLPTRLMLVPPMASRNG